MEAKPRRFTGRQLMIMFIVLCVTLVAIPTAVFAVSTGSAVNIVDGTNPNNKAAVDATGRQKVDTGITTYGGLGLVSVVNGNINATPSPAKLFHFTAGLGFGDCTLLATPSGYATIITAIHATSAPEQGATADLSFFVNASGTCFNVLPVDTIKIPGPLMTQELTYPTGLGIQSGHRLAVLENAGGGADETAVTVTGYEVPSAMCTGDCQ